MASPLSTDAINPVYHYVYKLSRDLPEKDIRYFAGKAELPVIRSVCPANGHTEREEMKRMLSEWERRHRGLRHRIYGAMQKANISGLGLPGKTADKQEETDETESANSTPQH